MADHKNIPFATRGAARSRGRLGAWLLAAVLSAAAQAQVAQPAPGSPAPGAARAGGFNPTYRCELGEYRGPAPDRRGHLYERYIWAVTPEFARQYCMPAHTVSTELTGAAAVAFRMVEGADTDGCRVTEDGKSVCNVDTTGRFEIYLPQSLNLPAANPEVKFFDRRRNTSEWMFEHVERSTRGQRYRTGQYRLPAGQIPRFTKPFPVQDNGYVFLHRFEYQGRHEGSGGSYFETGFVADILKGMDLLILEESLTPVTLMFEAENFRRAGVDPASPDGRYVFIMVKADSTSDRAPIHTIRLPHTFSRQVRELGKGPGSGPRPTLQQITQPLLPGGQN